jgi:transposase
MARVGRFVLARRRGQALSPRHSSGRPRRFDRPEKLEALRAQLRAEPDLSLVERCERLRQEQGLQVSEATLSRVLRRVLGWSQKKISLQARERDEAERAAWRARADQEFKAESLVFVDESGCNLALTPRYGSRAPRRAGRGRRMPTRLSQCRSAFQHSLTPGSMGAIIWPSKAHKGATRPANRCQARRRQPRSFSPVGGGSVPEARASNSACRLVVVTAR